MFKEKAFLFWLCFCCPTGVFGDSDEVKSVSGTEGDSVTLNSDLAKIQTGQMITWTFGPNGPLIAETDGVIHVIHDGPDERFRDRLKLNNQTGSLTIMNITNTDSGLYEVEISSSRTETKYRFNVTVCAATTPDPHSTSHSTSRPSSGSPSGPPSGSPSGPPSGSPGIDPVIVLISAAAAGSLLLVASVGIFCICRKQRKTNQQVEPHEAEITYADPIFYKKNAQKMRKGHKGSSQPSRVCGEVFLQKWRRQKAAEAHICSGLQIF